MALKQSYYELWFESFLLENISGHTSPVQLRLASDESVPTAIQEECEKRGVDPYSILTECNKDFFNYPVGTRFCLKAKLTDRKGGGLFFYSSYRWKPFEIEEAE